MFQIAPDKACGASKVASCGGRCPVLKVRSEPPREIFQGAVSWVLKNIGNAVKVWYTLSKLIKSCPLRRSSNMTKESVQHGYCA